MIVRVVPLQADTGIKFDLCLETGYVRTFTLSEYELRAYRSASVADIVAHVVREWLETELEITEFAIVFC